MNQFISLPSGLRVNTAHILEYKEWTQGTVSITQAVQDPEGGRLVFEETMTAEQLDDLLRGPATSPIVSPILELRLPRPNEPVMFKWDNRWKHGIVQSPQVEDDKIIIVSDGEEYQYDLPSAWTVKL